MSAQNANTAGAPRIGSVIKFADIDWRVLDLQGNKVLLISEKILEKRSYNVKIDDITWEQCSLREYLNNEFYHKLGAAKSAIAETRNSNPNNPWFGTSGGNATTDKVFLLSLDELVKYFGDSGQLKNKNPYSEYRIDDKYNLARIAYDKYDRRVVWWLRSPGVGAIGAADVGGGGAVDVRGFSVSSEFGVRPALWLNLESVIF